jgi:alkanesulfonate monooxygenase SsuD/methylene tetrahydromethanopterin reductase-like flavin-dependent oxidoreductase (luciferase family)
MEEGLDLVLKTWTTDGPFRWEGKHYHNRLVNPWVRPLQQPAPPVWIPGIVSRETIAMAARRGFPYIALATSVMETGRIWETYDAIATSAGVTPGSEHRGYLMRIHVAESDERALANAREFMWQAGEFTGVSKPIWQNPSGYTSPARRREVVEIVSGRKPPIWVSGGFEQWVKDRRIIAGSPATVVRTLREVMEVTRPGIIVFWANDGRISHADSMTCIRLLGQEVMPAIRNIGRELGLRGPFDGSSEKEL